MSLQRFVRKSRIPAPAPEVFAWHLREGAFERMTPPWEKVRLIERSGGFEDGGRVVLELRLGPFRQRWVAEHRDYVPGRRFRDVQIEGPFASWVHTHTVTPDDPHGSFLEDEVEYSLPLGRLGAWIAGSAIRRKLESMFAYRHRTLSDDFGAGRLGGRDTAMKILVTGATGLVGSALSPFLTTQGHEVHGLGRTSGAAPNRIRWDPASGMLDAAALEGFDAVVHLAGENIAGGRWTEERKRRIRDSRVQGTRLLANTLVRLASPPKVLVCASATGYYGDRGSETLTEESPPGSGFLSDVCREWEASARPALDKGIRVVWLRIGIVLTPRGGALAKMLPPFRMGVGGNMGNGEQYWSWISIDDLAAVIHYAVVNEGLQGPVNATSPQPVTNADFTRILARVLKRPAILPLPAFAARIMLGEMADALLLSSARVEPARLLAAGYEFRHPDLEAALRHVLGKA